MAPSRADRRVQRTRQLLSDALRSLMHEKRYDRITVQDLIDRANVGRSTFYAHYRDKEELLLSDFARMIAALEAQVDAHAGAPTAPSLALFRHVQQHHALYTSLLCGRGMDLVYKKGHGYLQDAIERQLVGHVAAGPAPAVPLPLVADYLAGALLTMLRWWLEHDMPYPPEQIDALFQQLVSPGVAAALHGAPP